MKTPILTFLVLSLLIISCKNDVASEEDLAEIVAPHAEAESGDELTDEDREKLKTAVGKSVDIISFTDLEKRFDTDNDTLYIYNFWATWCAPCIKEMPYFEQIIEENADKKIKLVFVSMDFLKDLEDRVVPFVREKGIIAECVLLDEKELTMTEWINRLSKDWEGEIPATLMIKGSAGIKEFYAREFTFNQLQAIVTPLVI